MGHRDDGADVARRAPPRAPRPTPGRGCRWARRAAAGCCRPARAGGSAGGPAGRRRASRTAAGRSRGCRSGAGPPSPCPARRRASSRCRGRRRRAARGGRGSGRSSRARPGRRAATSRSWPTGSPASRRRKWLLPVPLGPSTADALAVDDLGVERIGEAVQLELLADHDPRAGAVAAEAHRHLVVDDPLGRRGRLEALDLASSWPAPGTRRCRCPSTPGAGTRRAIACIRLRSSCHGGARRRCGPAAPRGPRARWRTTRRAPTRCDPRA